MRRTFTLTDESRQVISGHVKEIAREYGCDPSYLYQMLAGYVTDWFAPFEAGFKSMVHAGVDVTPYITRLRIIMESQAMPSKEVSIGHVTANFHREATEATAAHLEDKPLEVRLKEAQEAKQAAADLELELIRQINKRDAPLYNGKPYDLQKRRGVS